MNIRFGNIGIIDADPWKVPISLEIGFPDKEMDDPRLYGDPQAQVEEIIEYWCNSSAIANGCFFQEWVNENTLVVTADFDKGSFKGDLLYHNALIEGDKKFNIGLAKLFCKGYTPKTSRGEGVAPSPVTPLYIKCLYSIPTTPNRIRYDVESLQRKIEVSFNCILNHTKRILESID